MLTAVANTAFRRKPCLNGMCLVKPKYTAITMITINTIAEAHRVGPLQLDDRDLVVASPPAPTTHFCFPFSALGLVMAFLAVASSGERRGGYFSPNRFFARLVISRLVPTLAAGRLPIDGLALFVGLVARFAHFRLARAGHVRVRVDVHVVVVVDGVGADERLFDRGPVGRSRGREALVVGPGRREHDAGARERAHADVLRQQARDVAERQRHVVAGGLLGRQSGDERVAVFERLGEVFEAERDDRVLGEGLQRLRRGGQFAVQRGGGAEVDGALGEGVAKRLGDGPQRVRARTQQAHELGALFDERRLERQRVGRLFERGGAPLDGFFERGATLAQAVKNVSWSL